MKQSETEKSKQQSSLPRKLFSIFNFQLSIIAFFLFQFSFFISTAQNVPVEYMVNGDSLFFSNCHQSRGQIVFQDLGNGDEANYSTTGFDGWAIVDLTDRTGNATANYHLGDDANSYIDIWDGSTLLNHMTGNGSCFHTISSGTLRIHVHTSPHSPGIVQNLNLVWMSDSLSGHCHGLHTLNIHNVGKHSAIVNWNNGVDSVCLNYGNGAQLVLGNNYTVLTGLDSLTHYSVSVSAWRDRYMECCIMTDTFTTTLSSPPNCIDVIDLESPFVTCTYGDFSSPNDTVGIFPGRHTIMTDPNVTDHNTDDQLHVVPPGHSSALRLGNEQVGARAESIICQMTVDTNLFDILLLKYAVVLQDPSHLPESQPRFSFKLYDEEMHAVDASCGAVDFVANSGLGWNHSGSINLWKNWTTTGFNLSAYHGRTLNVVFTTRDCVGGEHFGYAYLVTDCFRKGLSTPHCGVDPPATLTAPPGFNYQWYTSNDTTRIVSYDRTVQVDEPGATYTCIMSYIDNPECTLSLSVFAGSRYPLADFSYTIVTSDCIHFNVAFENHSTVSPDGVTPSPTGELCESAFWDFGNGQTSTEFNPIAHYDSAGTYTVTLVSSISSDECKDTMVAFITLPTYHVYEEHYNVCDSMTWQHDGVTYYDDTIGPMVIYPAPDFCDTAYVLHLNVNRTPLFNVPRDTSCWSSPYSWRGHILDEVPDSLTVVRLADTLTNIYGCDSVVAIDVLRVPKYSVDFDANADCYIKQYRLLGLSDAPFHTWSSSPIDPAVDGHATDSMLILSPSVITTYTYHATFLPDGFCPTEQSIALEPVSFPTAQLRLKPEYMTLDNMKYEAIDLGDRNNGRSWLVTEYLDGQPYNTLRPLPEPRFSNSLSAVVDSVNVVLDVSNGFCHDTASGTIPLVRTNIFAPNIFTPALNDNNLFQIIASGVSEVELDIYNRQGLIMFHTNDLSHPWDGTKDGRPCEQGAYTWRLRYLADDNRIHRQETIGTVVLIR